MATQNLLRATDLRIRRLWLVMGWTFVLLVVYLSLTPSPLEFPIEEGDKLSHALAYFVLMSWFANLYDTPVQRMGFALGFICLGIALEFIQRWTGYRTFELSDVTASAIGVAMGWLLVAPRVPNYLILVERIWHASVSTRDE